MLQNRYNKPILLYDGVCNLCSGAVKFVIKNDPKDRFYFASLQSETGKGIMRNHELDANEMDTFVFIKDDVVFIRSSAALHLFREMGFPWNLSYALILVPGQVRDAVYKFISRHRYKWFGKKDSCMVPDEKIKGRFLDWGESVS